MNDAELLNKIKELKNLNSEQYTDLILIYKAYLKHKDDSQNENAYNYNYIRYTINNLKEDIESSSIYMSQNKKIKLRKLDKMLDNCLYNLDLQDKRVLQVIIDLITYTECVLNCSITYPKNLANLLEHKVNEYTKTYNDNKLYK